MTSVKNRIKKWRRDRLRDQIILSGEAVRRMQVVRAGIDSDEWPDECAQTDATLDRLQRRHDALLTKFKEAA